MEYDEQTYNELSKKIRINRDFLDAEIIEQPNLFFHASEGFVHAVAKRDKSNHSLEVEIAELDKDIREQMIADGERVTEDKVAQQIKREQDYHRFYKEHLDASLVANRWSSLKESYRQRADMLKSLVQLHISGYFGEVTGSAERKGAHDRFNQRG